MSDNGKSQLESIKSRLKSVSEAIGLDWLPIIWKDKKFKKHEQPTEERKTEIINQAEALDLASAEFVTQKFEKLIETEEDRRKEIDTKATAIIGFSGISSGIIVGLAPLIIGTNSFALIGKRVISVLYLAIGGSLVISVILAQRAIEVGKRPFMAPDHSDLINLRMSNKTQMLRVLAGDLLRSYEYNLALINDKASYTRGAQDWFRNTVFMICILIFVLAIGGIFVSSDLEEPIQVIIISATPSPTILASPTHTHTSTSLPMTSIPTASYTPTQSRPATNTPMPKTAVAP